jgi:gluconolactonase
VRPRIDVLCDNVDHAECVTWDPRGRVVFGTESAEIWSFDVEHRVKGRLAVVSGFVLGVAVDGHGDVYACDRVDRTVWRCSSDGSVTVRSAGAADRPFRTPNHLAFHPSGSLYVSDSGASWEARDGAILTIDANGDTAVGSSETPAFPNGIAVDPDGTYLYVLESSEPRLSRLPIAEDGALGPVELLAELPRTVPDGIAIVTDGSVLVSCFKPDAILRFRDGRTEILAQDWQGRFLNSPTNLCFFGPGLDRVACANLGDRTIVEVEYAGAPGAPLHYPPVAI